ncbi:MAG: hypothetical protein ACLFUH_04000 [Bacteroidales bacterium]
MNSKYETQHNLFKLICKIIAGKKANEVEIKYLQKVAAKKGLYSNRSTAKQGIRNMCEGDRYPVKVKRAGVIMRTDIPI